MTTWIVLGEKTTNFFNAHVAIQSLFLMMPIVDFLLQEYCSS